MGQWVQEPDVRTWLEDATSEQISSLIDLAEGQAVAVAPQLAAHFMDETQQKAIRGILIAAIRRWWDVGSGAVSQRTVGPFSQTVASSAIVGQFYPSEVKALARIGNASRVFSFSTMPDVEDRREWPEWVVNRPESEVP